MKLLISAVTKMLAGLILVGLLLFLSAGTLSYNGAWAFIALLFIPILILGIVLFIKAPKLLEKRLNTKEKEKTQKGVVGAYGGASKGREILITKAQWMEMQAMGADEELVDEE